jgi:hypothetical protein
MVSPRGGMHRRPVCPANEDTNRHQSVLKVTIVNFIGAVLAVVLSASNASSEPLTRVDSHTPRAVQVQIAKLAAPKEVSGHANIYVLGEHGYELAERGDNGFSCLIDRERPDTMEPECFDAAGTRSTLKVRLFQEQQRANGVSDEDITRSIREGYKSGKFRAPSKPGIVYMLSDHNYVFDPDSKQIIHFPGHLMFYAPYATQKTVGAGEGAPYIVHPGEPDALMIVVPAKLH